MSRATHSGREQAIYTIIRRNGETMDNDFLHPREKYGEFGSYEINLKNRLFDILAVLYPIRLLDFNIRK